MKSEKGGFKRGCLKKGGGQVHKRGGLDEIYRVFVFFLFFFG